MLFSPGFRRPSREVSSCFLLCSSVSIPAGALISTIQFAHQLLYYWSLIPFLRCRHPASYHLLPSQALFGCSRKLRPGGNPVINSLDISGNLQQQALPPRLLHCLYLYCISTSFRCTFYPPTSL